MSVMLSIQESLDVKVSHMGRGKPNLLHSILDNSYFPLITARVSRPIYCDRILLIEILAVAQCARFYYSNVHNYYLFIPKLL